MTECFRNANIYTSLSICLYMCLYVYICPHISIYQGLLVLVILPSFRRGERYNATAYIARYCIAFHVRICQSDIVGR